MSDILFRRTGALVALFAAGLVFPASALAQDMFQEGVNRLDQKRPASAYDALAKSLQQSDDPQLRARIQFYMALARQDEAGLSETTDEQRNKLLREAEELYRRVVEVHASGSALNNLAMVAAARGDRETARDSYMRALALADAQQPIYALNYADFLFSTDPDAALRFYDLAYRAQPHSRRALKGLLRYFKTRGTPRLLKTLWDFYQDDRVVQTQTLVLELLADQDLDDAKKQALLTPLAYCLSRQGRFPDEFAKSPTADRLRELAGQEPLRAPLEEILELYDFSQNAVASFDWWSQAVGEGDAPSVWGWPLDGFAALAVSLGLACEAAAMESPDVGPAERAESYYRLAYNQNPEFLYPLAVQKLADLWIGRNQRQKLETFLEEQEGPLFYGKGEAIASGRAARIYQFHRSLGIVYAYLDRWGDPDRPASALFQLEHALDAADTHNARQLSERIVAPELVLLLTKGLARAKSPERAVATQLDYVDYYRELGEPAAAAELFAAIDGSNIRALAGAEAANRYRLLASNFENGTFPPENPQARATVFMPTSAGAMKPYTIFLWGTAGANNVPNAADIGRLFVEYGADRRIAPGAYQVLGEHDPPGLIGVEFDGFEGKARLDRPGADTKPLHFTIQSDKGPQHRLEPFQYIRP